MSKSTRQNKVLSSCLGRLTGAPASEVEKPHSSFCAEHSEEQQAAIPTFAYTATLMNGPMK